MTTRDPRPRVPEPSDPGRGPVREVTASMSIDISDVPAPAEPDDDERISHPSLAVGTGLPSDVSSSHRNEATAIASPSGRNKTPQPKDTKPPPVARSGDDPQSQLGAILGAYRLTELLGKGGMGYVYRAEHVKLGREVALKLLRGDYAKRRDAVLRFFQEAKTVNRVRHRNIVDVTDFVELDDGTTFIIMELLQGQSLGKWARGGIALPRALAVLVQICDGLGAAHAVGVVHRDLKPDNVFVIPTSDGAELVKLLDFGVAKLVNRDDEDVGFQTAAGSVIGTPAYMSPEQAGGMNVDHRSDIYSLGAIMYELFCGHPMFRGRSFGEYVRKHLTEMPVPPRQTQGGARIDERLEALILKCLAKEPSERFSSIVELRDGLMHLLGGIETQPPGSVVLPPMPPPPRTTPGVAPPPPMQTLPGSSIHSLNMSQYTLLPDTAVPAQAHPWKLWLIGSTIAIGIGVAAAVWYSSSSNAPSPSAAPQHGPTAAPIEPAASAPAMRRVEIRFDSLPAGGVYADGRSAELCQTPCSFQVDLGDGGPTDKRTFVVRADGYEDKRVEVDFLVSQRDFSVSLTRLAGAPIGSGTRDEGAQIVDAAKEPGDARKGKKSRKGRKGKGSTKETETKDEAAVIAEPPPPPPPPPPEPKVEEKKPPKKIDRTDTIDPFKK